VALGDRASSWQTGDRVMGRGLGCYAEFTVVNQRALMRIPDAIGFAEAAAIPNVFVTAHDAIVSAAAAGASESLMVTAGPSGVGTAALQIARYLKAQPVIATTRSGYKSSALRKLGADEVVEAGAVAWLDRIMAATRNQGVDTIIDQVGGPMLADNI